MEHVLSLPTVSRRALLLFWLVVLCVPLLFLRSSMVSLIREDERNLTEQARRALREEMTAFLDDLSLPKQILNSLRSVESRSSRLATLTGLKQLDSEQGIADLLLLELARELPAEPLFLLIDPGHGRPPEIRYNTRLFTPLSAPSRRLAELWLRSLKDVLSPEERQRLDRTVCNLLGELVSTNLPPDQVQESFSVRLGHERLLLAGRTLTETPTAPFRRWIIAFRDRDFRLTQIIRQAVSQSLRHQCRRQVRFSTTDESGATFDLTRAHLRYSLPMPRLLFAQGTDIPQRGIESPLPRPQ
ncbi:MAG TPA: hypothetical protein PKO06_00075, partial [Candidatus Ozemobacteraceae bacterium]|nr:hypothetical protein [Candidatus Ozemobacteraceae bacterium]